MNMFLPWGIAGARPTVHQLINNTMTGTTISGGGQVTPGNTVTYNGLPVIGFAVRSYMNGILMVGGQTVLSNYGGNFVHKTNTTIQ